ncbi:MAG: nuclear transport factor 2 family protein [Pseudomonadota bacterium]
MKAASDQDEFKQITRRLYEVVSAKGGHRDWESVRSLYHPRATMVRTGIGDNGKPFVLAMTFDEYVANAADKLSDVRFTEKELDQEVQVFGNVARLASVYEFTRQSAGETERGRGVNFFNLVNEGQGWKIMNIVWDNEREGLSLADAGFL